MEKLYRYQGNTSLIQNWIDRDSKQREAVYKCSIKSEYDNYIERNILAPPSVVYENGKWVVEE
jgi:hypothetical protein